MPQRTPTRREPSPSSTRCWPRPWRRRAPKLALPHLRHGGVQATLNEHRTALDGPATADLDRTGLTRNFRRDGVLYADPPPTLLSREDSPALGRRRPPHHGARNFALANCCPHVRCRKDRSRSRRVAVGMCRNGRQRLRGAAMSIWRTWLPPARFASYIAASATSTRRSMICRSRF